MSQKTNSSETSASAVSAPPPKEVETLRRILRALSGLEYGSVEIIVQNSKVIQIERTQRWRFSDPLEIPAG